MANRLVRGKPFSLSRFHVAGSSKRWVADALGRLRALSGGGAMARNARPYRGAEGSRRCGGFVLGQGEVGQGELSQGEVGFSTQPSHPDEGVLGDIRVRSLRRTCLCDEFPSLSFQLRVS